MTVRQILIRLYACPTWEQIDNTQQYLLDAFHEDSYSAVLALPAFKEERERVSAARRRIAHIAERYPDSVDQALQCLVELQWLREKSEHRVSQSPDYEVVRDLIARTVGVSWPALV